MRKSTGLALAASEGVAAPSAIAASIGNSGCLMALKWSAGATILRSPCLTLLAREERVERRHRFLGAHPLAEQMAFLIDPAGHVFGRQLQELSRDCDGLRRQRANLARHLARL